jgi:C-methyltransferase
VPRCYYRLPLALFIAYSLKIFASHFEFSLLQTTNDRTTRPFLRGRLRSKLKQTLMMVSMASFTTAFLLRNNLYAPRTPVVVDAVHGNPHENLLQLAQAHMASQALRAIIELDIPEILGANANGMSLEQLVNATNANCDALLRTLRILATVGIIEQDVTEQNDLVFSLSTTGALLRKDYPVLSPFIQHYMDPALWNAWSELPGYVAGKFTETPFERANGGRTITEYFEHNPQARQHRNNVVKSMSPKEIPWLVENLNWDSFRGQTIVDVGGGHGELMERVKHNYPDLVCINFDLPNVIRDSPERHSGVRMLAGDMFKALTLPSCDVIICKHVLCDCDDEQVMRALRSFHAVLWIRGKLIIADAVLIDGPQAMDLPQVMVAQDLQLMMVGGKKERSVSQWVKLATAAGFVLESVQPTAAASMDVMNFRRLDAS